MADKEKVEFWAVVELFGRQQIAGHLTEAEIGEVAALVNQLFERNWSEKTGDTQSGSTTAARGLTPAQRRRLH